jgi:ribosomal protein S18 acetylase RimI-like enzyme
MDVRRLGPNEVETVLAASPLFDEPADPDWARTFLQREGHHLLMAFDDGTPIGFVSGVETTHPDKGTEMFLYELGVGDEQRRRGVGKALVLALADLAIEQGCHGMWVGTESDNSAALATYRAAGAGEPEPFVTLSWSFPVRRERPPDLSR